MTGLEGTARHSEKPTVVGRSEIEDLMAPKFDPNEVKARKDSQRFPQVVMLHVGIHVILPAFTIQINPCTVGKCAIRPMDPMGTLRIRLLKYSNSFISFV